MGSQNKLAELQAKGLVDGQWGFDPAPSVSSRILQEAYMRAYDDGAKARTANPEEFQA